MIGKLLRLWRAVENIGLREAAKELGISPATLSRIENGKSVDAATFLKLIYWLFGSAP